ncbi:MULTISPECIES: radical SAM protein [unclassified Mycobacterium]|uniref:SPL family radical SAM protein n=1 Tax=unclassified Mycobacterium TaxID=2642494 RepID=UPI0007FC9259|nr:MULTISPECIES: radical SAM protein [unclassified Mycobacterium]OBG74790.1 radical SAM protein [Mycobacterium sp. E1214]OBH27452.1 radical SAM protein [Mycobacterium sp. E1319]
MTSTQEFATAAPTLWVPSRVLVTKSASELPHGAAIVARCEAAGVADIVVLNGDRLPPTRAESERAAYALAKRTLAVVVAPPSKRRLQPIPPSADWRIDLAEGCPAHCQYCYLAGSLSGPPITRVYANLPEILGEMDGYVGRGTITSASPDRAEEGTTFEASCYTDPLALEHLTGSLSATIAHVGTREWAAPVGLRFTTKFDDVAPLLALPHAGRTRVRMSVNAPEVSARFEGGTARLPRRIAALRALAQAGYRVGLTIAPIMPVPGWREGYGTLLRDVAAALDDVPGVDLTVECITHRFSAASKKVLLDWYPRTKLEMDEAERTRKIGKFGAAKFVYPKDTMTEMRSWFDAELAGVLPAARALYWT